MSKLSPRLNIKYKSKKFNKTVSNDANRNSLIMETISSMLKFDFFCFIKNCCSIVLLLCSSMVLSFSFSHASFTYFLVKLN